MKKLYYKSNLSYIWKFNKKFANEHVNEKYFENIDHLNKDSKWPSFFPCNVSFVLIKFKNQFYVEKIIGATIINRFPLILALPISKKKLSERHLNKQEFIKKLKNCDNISINLLHKKDIKNLNFKNKYFNQIELLKKNVDQKNQILKNAYTN